MHKQLILYYLYIYLLINKTIIIYLNFKQILLFKYAALGERCMQPEGACAPLLSAVTPSTCQLLCQFHFATVGCGSRTVRAPLMLVLASKE